MKLASVLSTFLLGCVATSSAPIIAEPTISLSAVVNDCALPFAGTVVSESDGYVTLADAQDGTRTVRVMADLVESSEAGRLCLRAAPEQPVLVAPPPSSGTMLGEDSNKRRGRSCPRKECRGLVEFCCRDNGTSDPVGVCVGIRDCTAE